MVSRGWEASARHMPRIFIGACPQSLRFQPSWPQTLAVVSPLCPDNSRRDAGIISAHCHRLIESGSEQNRSRQIAPTCPNNEKPSKIFRFVPTFDLANTNIIYFYYFILKFPTRLSFQITYPRFDSILREYFSLFDGFDATVRFFLFFLGTPNYEGRVLHDSFRSRGHATPPLERGTTWRALDS